jgi:hypothetical protein
MLAGGSTDADPVELWLRWQLAAAGHAVEAPKASALLSALNVEGASNDPAIQIVRSALRSANFGHDLAQTGKWAEAAAVFEFNMALHAEGPDYHWWRAMMLLAANDEAGYQSACENLLAEYADSDATTTRYWVAVTCWIVPARSNNH